MFRNRLPTPDNMAKRHGSDGTCAICRNAEDANHIFFRCHIARFAWSAVREAFDQIWNPSSGADLLSILKAHKGPFGRVLWHSLGCFYGLCLLGTKLPLRSASLLT